MAQHRPSTTPPRSELHLADLKERKPATSRLMNVKIPTHVADAISEITEKLGASKTEVVIALLNEGLAVARAKLGGRLG